MGNSGANKDISKIYRILVNYELITEELSSARADNYCFSIIEKNG